MVATPNASLEALSERIATLEAIVGELSRTANKTVFAAGPNRDEAEHDSRHPRRDAVLPSRDASYLRDMGATLVDRARARLLEAQAESQELENAALRRPADDLPFQAHGWKVSSDSARGTVTATARDLQGREIRVETTPDRARWLAEHLLSGARNFETAEP